MTDLEVGRTYRPDEMSPSDWVAHVAELREGDEVEVWRSNHSGVRGLVAADRRGGLVVRSAVTGAVVGRLTNCDGPLTSVSEFTVTKLVPRGPSWAGARAVVVDGRMYVNDELLGPVYALIDADGRVPVDGHRGVCRGCVGRQAMSEPYTPTTEDVQAAYGKRAVLGTPAMAADYEEADAQFARWLAAHDAKVKAESLREVADSFSPDVRRGAPIHPALISAALRSRADKIEKGSTDE